MRLSEHSSSATRAAPPFNSKDSNVILRSTDDIEFRVHRQVLELASPVLAALVARSTSSSATSYHMPYDLSRAPSASGASGSSHHRKRPILELPHTSDTLDLFLRFVYPTPEPPLMLNDIATLLQLAERYDAEAVTKRMRTHLLLPEHLESDPLSVYALASHAGLVDVIQLAARRILPLCISPATLAGMDFQSGRALTRLVQYHAECSKAVADVVNTNNTVPWWVQMQWRRLCFLSECSECAAVAPCRTLVWHKVLRGCVDVPQYWVGYMVGVRAALEKTLDPRVARDPALVRPAVEAGMKCPRCASKVYWDMEEFAKLLEDAIDEAISSVKFPLDDLDEYDIQLTPPNKGRYLLPSDNLTWPEFQKSWELYCHKKALGLELNAQTGLAGHYEEPPDDAMDASELLLSEA